MKVISFFFLIGLMTIFNCTKSVVAQDYQGSLKNIETSELDGIENRIQNAMNQSFMQQDAEPLEGIVKELEGMERNAWVDYWHAFALFRKAIFEVYGTNDNSSETTLEKALAILNDSNEMTSEHYALRGMIRSFSVQFASGMKAGILSQKVSSDFKKALKLDDKNLRAYYGKGAQDYYTPEEYGGGKKVEEYLTQAIALENQYHDYAVLPTWGKDEAYEVLLRYYIKNEKYEKAKTLFQEAIKAYPKHYQLAQIGAQLVGK